MGNFIPTRRGGFKPRLVSANSSSQHRELAASVMPKGATLVPRTPQQKQGTSFFGGNMPMGTSPLVGGGGGSASYHMQRPYMPGIESPDRVQFPKSRLEANRAWRLFHETDPIFGTAVDMYAEMLVSDFDIIVGDEKSREIRDTLQYMCQVTNLIDRFKYIVREYLVMGECIPHAFFDDNLGIWTYIGMHNPDYIDIVDTPIVNMDPIINFIPDEDLRRLMSDGSPEAREFRSRLPAEFVSKILARQKIRLSPLNCSFIARKLHPYQVRGTSLGSRLWRIFMVEDAVYNSTIATFRRAACFVAGTKVLTSEGAKNIEDIRIADQVISGDGQFKDVVAAWSEPTDEIVEITTMGSESLECTPNHRFKIWARPRKCACGCGTDLEIKSGGTPRFFVSGHYDFRRDPKTGRMTSNSEDWQTLSEQPQIRMLSSYEPLQVLNAEDIRKGDYLLIPRKFEEIPVEVTEENKLKARLLGYYAAEGCPRQIKEKGVPKLGITWTFNLREFDTWAEDLVQIGKELGVHIRKRLDLRPSDETREGRTVVTMDHVADLYMAEWCFEHAGKYSAQKSLSETVMRWPLELKKELLKGMYRGDGHKSKDEMITQYGTVSESLAYQVRIILAQLGVFGSVHRAEKDNPNWNDCYSISACGGGNRVLRALIWGVETSDEEVDYSHSWTWKDDDYIYVPVRKVRRRQQQTAVYNLTVDGDHSYIANGLATLNSPIKVIKLGDPQTGWIPSPGSETKLLEMLNRAETDPQSWLIYNYGINFEAWGTNERATSIGKEHDVIERVKLLGLGLSKSFMTGESTFACLLPYAQVAMGDGTYRSIENVQKDEIVKDRYGKCKRVTEVLKYPTPEEMVEINLYGNRTFTMTGNHALPVFARPRTCQCGCGGMLWDEKQVSQGLYLWRSFLPGHHKNCDRAGRDRTWIEYKNDDQVVAHFPEKYDPFQRMEASQVKKGDWLMIPRTFEKSETPVNRENLLRARLLGYYTAEGSTSVITEHIGSKVTQFSFGMVEKEKRYVADVIAIVEELGYAAKCNIDRTGKHTVYVPTSATVLSNWLVENAHQGSANKHFSEEVMGWDLELKKELIKGMYRGDGYAFRAESSIRLDVNYVTISEVLSLQLELILAQLGFACSTKLIDERIDKKGYVHKPCYYVFSYGKHAYPLAELVWKDVPEVWDAKDFDSYNERNRGHNTEIFKDDDYLYIPVKSVKVVEVDRERYPHVYSLTVEGTHSYTIENVASFNSSKSGLQVFLRRLLSLRQHLENIWLYPKFFRPISEINEWTTASPSEVNHRYRIKRTAQEIQEQNLILMPTLKWKNKLDPTVDTDLLNAYKMLEQGFGLKLSKTTISTPVGIDWQDELDKSLKEFKTAEEMKENILGKALVQKFEQQGQQAAPPGAPGSGAKPPAAAKPPGMGGAGGLQLGGGGGMDDASRPPGSADGGGAMSDGIEAPSGGGLPTGVV